MKKEYKRPFLKVTEFAKENIVTDSGIEAAKAITGGTNGVAEGNVTTVEKVLTFA